MTSSFDLALPENRQDWINRLLALGDESQWKALARELFTWQYARVPAYRRLCEAREISHETFGDWKKIPAVPQVLFKRQQLYCHGLPEPSAIYETSGTTTGQPGRQHLLSTDIYEAVCVEGARSIGLFQNKPQLHFLTPSPEEAPHSSLSAMFGFWQKACRQTGRRFWAKKEHFEFTSLRRVLEKEISRKKPIGLAGTAFSFVHLLDAWANLPPLRFPAGSWILETGGFKGRSREIAKADLYAQLAGRFTVPDEQIWNEYGMSELSSQAYACGTHGLHATPPWARVLVCDPATGREVRMGKQGLVRWIDLANTDSLLALQTLDVAERIPEGFRLLGRLPRSEPRGCSLSAEDLAAGLAQIFATT